MYDIVMRLSLHDHIDYILIEHTNVPWALTILLKSSHSQLRSEMKRVIAS